MFRKLEALLEYLSNVMRYFAVNVFLSVRCGRVGRFLFVLRYYHGPGLSFAVDCFISLANRLFTEVDEQLSPRILRNVVYVNKGDAESDVLVSVFNWLLFQ